MKNMESEISVTRESKFVENRLFLNGVKELIVERVSDIYEVIRKIDPESNEQLVVSKKLVDTDIKSKSFNLTEVTPEELLEYRKNKIPSFVLKVNGKLFHTTIPNNIHFFSSNILGEHLCSNIREECRRLSPASDANGGCAKVRNCAKFIERYPWIPTGYETFCTHQDSFVVVKCMHYERLMRRRK